MAGMKEGSSGMQIPPPTPTEVDVTAGWLIYTNTAYGYSFRYPDYAELGELGQETGLPETSWQAVYLRLPTFYVEIISHDNPEHLSSIEYAEQRPPYVQRTKTNVFSLGGHEACQFDFLEARSDDTGTFAPMRAILIAHGDKVLELWVKPLTEGRFQLVESADGVNPSFGALLSDSTSMSGHYQVLEAVLSSLVFSD